MIERRRVTLRTVAVSVLAVLPSAPALASSWAPRNDVGVAAVDTRTGEVLWEAWRPDEVPAAASRDEKAVVAYLLAVAVRDRGPMPPPLPPLPVPLLENVPIEGLPIDKPWSAKQHEPRPAASLGKGLIYYRHSSGVTALDRQTKKEVWRLPTTRYPYPSYLLEVGENRAFVQIGSKVPVTLHAAVVDGDRGRLRVYNLEPHTPGQRVAAAVLLHHYGDGHLRPQLRTLTDQLRQKNDPAAGVIEKLLAAWPVKRDPQRLLDGCVAALLRADGGAAGGELARAADQRKLAWCLLQELIYGSPKDGYSHQGNNYSYDGWKEQPVTLADATKEKLVDHCRLVLATGPDVEKPFAASVLVSTAVGWGRLTDPERKALLLSDHPSVWRWAAVGLAKNGPRERLIDGARGRPAADYLDVIWILRHDRWDPPKEWAAAELGFWVAAAGPNPGGVAYVLNTADGPAPAAFREPIRAYLVREAANPAAKVGGTNSVYDLYAAMSALDRWKDPADTPLLEELLKHPATHTVSRSDGGVRKDTRVYGVRGHARAMLEGRKVKVPPGIVYEEEVGPAKE